MSARVSVLTLVRGRHAQLDWVIEGLRRQTRAPDELVVAFMERPRALDPAPFPIRTLEVAGDPMPLARARNRAAAAAGDLLVFLDVDCIPAPDLVAGYATTAAAHDGMLLGEVRYLPAGALDGGLDYDRLAAVGVRHPDRPALAAGEVRAEPDASQLWGLSFALPRAAWDAVDGMDEAFAGYGGEETDFAWRFAAAGGRIAWAGGALAYHQHHAVHVPPLQHFDHILRNAALFRTRHGRWCMDYWLGQFRDAGLIAMGDERIEVLRRPTVAEIAATRRPGDVLFS